MPSLFPLDHGPLLPSFSTLLVKGPYPDSCPINLALSFPNHRSIIVLSSCDKENNNLRASLQGLRLTGKISAQAAQVQIFYLPTAAHMALLLSTLQVIDTERPNTSAVHDKYTAVCSPHLLKPPGPALVIIHEPSAYFTDSIRQSSPSSSYLSLLTRAISLTSRLGAALAVFDRHVNHLKMPVHPVPNPHLERIQAVAPLLANYMELIIDFSDLSNAIDGKQ
ncbi:hypothetical protein J3R30DRAFT_3709732 [Lentinula aciculospora]|uniref:Uncharacterized protein n=1 Tax=Lentinula aciculospora TaxID=153920 RepID=A0A9W9A1Y4_9AGAR|nr:hypothetical protein J3R30DRAFT_3709732 [Lentinula aciculospora]